MTSHELTVQKAYLAFYARPADPTGLSYWSGKLQNSMGDLSEIISDFANSSEFTDRFGGLSDSELISSTYESLFNRSVDDEGLAYYVGEIESGRKTVNSLTLDILNGASGTDVDILNNKVEFCDQFTQQVAAGDIIYASVSDAEKAAEITLRIDSNSLPFDEVMLHYNASTTEDVDQITGNTRTIVFNDSLELSKDSFSYLQEHIDVLKPVGVVITIDNTNGALPTISADFEIPKTLDELDVQHDEAAGNQTVFYIIQFDVEEGSEFELQGKQSLVYQEWSVMNQGWIYMDNPEFEISTRAIYFGEEYSNWYEFEGTSTRSNSGIQFEIDTSSPLIREGSPEHIFEEMNSDLSNLGVEDIDYIFVSFSEKFNGRGSSYRWTPSDDTDVQSYTPVRATVDDFSFEYLGA